MRSLSWFNIDNPLVRSFHRSISAWRSIRIICMNGNFFFSAFAVELLHTCRCVVCTRYLPSVCSLWLDWIFVIVISKNSAHNYFSLTWMKMDYIIGIFRIDLQKNYSWNDVSMKAYARWIRSLVWMLILVAGNWLPNSFEKFELFICSKDHIGFTPWIHPIALYHFNRSEQVTEVTSNKIPNASMKILSFC